MHFVTERELQTSYRQAPFTQFCLTNQERLTPEAKQFLLDKKIQIVTTPKENPARKVNSSLIGYQEILSAEVFEAVLLAMKKDLVISQKIMDLEDSLTRCLNEEAIDVKEIVEVEESFHLETVHIFSEVGPLLIQLKKIYGLLQLIQAKYPYYHLPLIEAKRKLIEIKKQLIGEAHEKTFNEHM